MADSVERFPDDTNLPPFILSIGLYDPASLDFSAYPYHLPAVKSLARSGLELHPKVTFFVGENGTGKSTLLEALAVRLAFNPEGGGKNFHFATRPTHSDLGDRLMLFQDRRPQDGFFLRAESFYNLASNIDDLGVANSYGGRSLHEQSHGESFLALFQKRFGADGLYLLDEPESALSPMRQLTLLADLHELVLGGCQFIIATHSPILMGYPNALIYEFNADGVRPVEYEQTEHYRTTRRFLENPARSLRILLGEDQ